MENLLNKVLALRRLYKSKIKSKYSEELIVSINNKDVNTVIYLIQHLLTDEYNSALQEVEYIIKGIVNDSSMWDYGCKDICECGHGKTSHHTGGQISYPDSTRCVHCICKMYLIKKL